MGRHVKPVEKKSVVPERFKKFTENIIKTGDAKSAPSARFVSMGFMGELSIIAAAFTLAAVLRCLPLVGWARFAVFVLPFALVGYPVFIKAVDEAANLELSKSEFIMTLASLACMALQEYSEAVALLGIYRICLLIRDYYDTKFRKLAHDFNDSWPDKAKVERDGEIIESYLSDVVVGETVVVEPGELIPIDGIVLEGVTSLRTENLTGDGPVIAVAPGSEAVSGCTNVTKKIRIRTIRDFENSVAGKLQAMVNNSAGDKTKRMFIADKLGKLFTPILTVIAILSAVVIPLNSGEWSRWLHCGVVILIASVPAAVLHTVPMIYFGGIISGAEAGVFTKHIDAVGRLSNTHTIVAEKTGIITDGEIVIEEVYTEGISETELLNIAAAVECNTGHPIAQAICRAGDPEAVAKEKVTGYSEVPGKGVSAYVDGKPVLVGTASHLTDHSILYKVPNQPGAAIHVAIDGVYRGYFLIGDRMRSKAFDAFESLRHQGVSNLIMLTGDVKSSARPLALKLGFDMAKFEMGPEAKLSAIKYLMDTAQGRTSLCFVGNGTDDGPMLEQADVGIAFDAMGTCKAMESADLIIMDDNIRKLPLTMKICKFINGIAVQNTLAFLAVKTILLFLALAGVVGIWFAIAAEASLFVFSLVNAARTIKKWV